MDAGTSKDDSAAREETRLLRLLAAPGAMTRIDGARLAIFGRKAGVSLRVGSVALTVARGLESAGALAVKGSAFVLTEAGAARMRRLDRAAPGDAFANQHRALALVETDGEGPRLVNEAESPLLWLYRRPGRSARPLVGAAEFAAGERLRADLTLSRALPRLTADWERAPAKGGGPGLTASEAMLAARQRVDRALAAVGPEFSGLLTDVCGFLKGMDAIEQERGWPARSAKVALSLALTALARHYGLGNRAVGAAGRRRRHVWGAADSRPDFPSLTPPAPDAHHP